MHFAAQSFVTAADVQINLVPYRGTAPVVTDVIAGHIQLGIADPPPSMGAIMRATQGDCGLLEAALSDVSDIPTFDEQGLKDFEITGWFGIVAPAATPREILIKLNAVVVAALKTPKSRGAFDSRHRAGADDERSVLRLCRQPDRQGGEDAGFGRQVEFAVALE